MKNITKVLLVSLIGILVLSGCKIKSFTPEPTETPVSVVESTVASEPTEEVVVVPTEPLPLFTDNGKMVCTVSPGLFPEISAEEGAIPPINEDDWVIGADDASLTIVIYDDFQCPACVSTYNSLNTWLGENLDDVQFVFRHFPLTSIHDKAQIASQAAEAAGLQGKFWEMYNILFAENAAWNTLTEEQFKTWVNTKADELGLDVKQFNKDMLSDAVAEKVNTAYQSATSLGLNSTPSIFFNGWYWEYARDYNTMNIILEVVKYEKTMVAECPDWVIDTDKTYTATIETENGEIVVDLFADVAPLAVNSFVFLAEKGYFDGVTFHRVMHDFVAQAGDPTGTGIAGPGYQFRNEISTGLTFDVEGYLAMANAGVDTNGSQFFITYRAAPELDGNYTIFGKVVEGMDIAKAITERDLSSNPDLPDGDNIISITIEVK